MGPLIASCRARLFESGPCGLPATEVVVTVNGWIIDCCPDCARWLCDALLVEESAPSLRR